jgi:hypothetical protein
MCILLLQEIRTAVRELEQKTREILAVTQSIHQPDGIKNCMWLATNKN